MAHDRLVMVVDALLYSRTLTQAGHTRRFQIRHAKDRWEVQESRDAEVVRQVRLDDWHRVERARLVFQLASVRLEENGWTAE